MQDLATGTMSNLEFGDCRDLLAPSTCCTEAIRTMLRWETTWGTFVYHSKEKKVKLYCPGPGVAFVLDCCLAADKNGHLREAEMRT